MSEPLLVKIFRKAEACLEDAKGLLAESSLEASINRSYYAVFHCIQALLFVFKGSSKAHVGSHTKFRELFIKNGDWGSKFQYKLAKVF